MKNSQLTGCAEYEALSRREVLSSLGALATSWIPEVAYTDDVHPFASTTPRDVIVTVFLRGGADGFALCAPWKDNLYTSYRRATSVAPPGDPDVLRAAVDLDGFFGLPQAMSPLAPLFAAKRLLIAHQTGQTNGTRSHFEAQHYMEAGKADMNLWSGWMGRHLASVTETVTGAALRSIALSGQLPLILETSPKAAVVTDLVNYGLGGDSNTVANRLDFLSNVYTSDPTLKTPAVNARKTIEVLQKVNYQSYQPASGVVYNPPVSSNTNSGIVTTPLPYNVQPFGEALKASAAILKANVGVESIHIDFGGWDSHQFEQIFEGRDGGGAPTFGGMFWNLRSLAANLAAFYADLDSVTVATGKTLMDRVTVVVMTEFGRTVNENGNQGTDHGQGGAMMFLGKNVKGGRVDRAWKALGNGGIDTYGGLAVTLDHRVFFGELLEKRLQNGANLTNIFPGYAKPVTGWRGAFA